MGKNKDRGFMTTTQEQDLLKGMRTYQDMPLTENCKKIFVDMEAGNGTFKLMKMSIDNKFLAIKEYQLQKKRNSEQIKSKEVWKTVKDFPTRLMELDELELENAKLDVIS